MHPYRTTHQSWNRVAAWYQEIFMDLDLYNDTYDTLIGLLPKPGARIFEIGCGPGNITRYLLAQRPDFRIEAIDVAPDMVRLAAKNNPTADCRVLDCRDIDRIDARYDAVVCGFVLPYLTRADCGKLIRDSAALLEPGGLFYCSVIEGDYAQSGLQRSSRGTDEMYVYYYDADTLRTFLDAAGLEPLQEVRKPYTHQDGSRATHLVLLARRRNTAPVEPER